MFYDFIYLTKGFRMRPKVWSTLKGTITNWSDIVFLLKLCILQEERLTGWKMK